MIILGCKLVKIKMAEQKTEPKSNISEKIISQINGAENILIALTSDPSVDEMTAALGLTLFLDKLGKHATAIYSGATPNALEFLQPEKTFEPNTNSLQDFIIALNKEKADHLRYKVDGDYVKIYITPYRTTLSESDLEFSHGDFNVDLVIALNVMAATDLDGALREHGRIVHDATSINITTNPPGKFGEIEWSNVAASSVSEMAAELAYALSDKIEMEKETATAFLTGVVAATNRFSNERTTSDTMILAAKLMGSGADPQLIAANLVGDESTKKVNGYVETGNGQVATREKGAEEASAPAANDGNMVIDRSGGADATGLDLRGGGAETNSVNRPMSEDDKLAQVAESLQAFAAPTNGMSAPEPTNQMTIEGSNSETVIPAPASAAPVTETGEKDYGKMIDEALAEPLPGEVMQPAVDQNQGAMPGQMQGAMSMQGMPQPAAMPMDMNTNPAASMAPQVPAMPEVNNVPEIPYDNGMIDSNSQPAAMGNDSYLVETPKTVLQPTSDSALPMPDGNVLPPPPPPVDFSMTQSQPAGAAMQQPMQPMMSSQPQMVGGIPALPQVQPMAAQPMQETQVQQQPAADAGAFQIPGM